MSGFSPWDPQGQRQAGGADGHQGPDPEPIVRRVRINFLLAALLAAAMVTVGLRPLASSETLVAPSGTATAAMAAVLVVLLALAWRNLAPDRLVVAGRRAADAADPVQRRPRAERARAMGFQGLALGWTMQAIALGMLPVFTGLLLQLLHRQTWTLVAFTGLGAVAGTGFERRITRAIHRAVEDPELRDAYGSS